MSKTVQLSQADQDRISKAVQAAEENCGAEIVPCIAPRSSRYEELPWKGAVLGGAFGVAAWILWHTLGLDWASASVIYFAEWILSMMTAGALAVALLPWFARWIAGKKRFETACDRRAKVEFLQNEVFATRERSGVLIFLSLYEHRAVILGDSGIHHRVKPEDWATAVQALCKGIQEGKPVEALEAAIQKCAELVRESGLVHPDEKNELSNELRAPQGDE